MSACTVLACSATYGHTIASASVSPCTPRPALYASMGSAAMVACVTPVPVLGPCMPSWAAAVVLQMAPLRQPWVPLPRWPADPGPCSGAMEAVTRQEVFHLAVPWSRASGSTTRNIYPARSCDGSRTMAMADNDGGMLPHFEATETTVAPPTCRCGTCSRSSWPRCRPHGPGRQGEQVLQGQYAK